MAVELLPYSLDILPTLTVLGTTVFTMIIGFVVFEALRLYLLNSRTNFFYEDFPFQITYRMATEIDIQLEAMTNLIEDNYKRTAQRTFSLRAFGLPLYHVTKDVKNIEHILNNVDSYGKKGLNTRLHGLLGDGIFNADGHQWFVHRKTSAHLFKLGQFKNCVLETFNHHADIVVRLLRKKHGMKIDFHDLAHRFTFESIAYIAFGLELGCIEDETVIFPKDFDYCVTQMNNSFIDPFWHFKRFCTPTGWEYFRALNRINSYAMKVIKDRREFVQKEGAIASGRVDLLSLYLDKDSFQGGGGGEKDELYMPPTDKNLRDVILNMIIAGRDTTAQALSWLFYNISIHQDVQTLIREEIRRVLTSFLAEEGKIPSLDGKKHQTTNTDDADFPKDQTLFQHLLAHNGEGFLSYKVLQQMKYIEAVCMETLRLHPSVPKELKTALHDDTLPDGTSVKSGDNVIFMPWAMGRDTELWGEDALEFKPDRFFNKAKVSPYIFTAFQAGPRTCLGQNFAILEMKAFITRLLLMFQFTLAQPKETVTYQSSLTLPMKGGLALNVNPVEWK